MDTLRELSDPQRTIALLLQPNVALLPTETIAVYLQSALKVFGHWAAEVSNRWDEEFLPETKRQVDEIMASLQTFVSSQYVEVQERVSLR